ncbi:MAG: ATP-dependent helicase [Candidatus Eremiobacteraeota bacterium]|nr:ATP-dependent helicase [Candidatus Eremiobacteraeota bacterium]
MRAAGHIHLSAQQQAVIDHPLDQPAVVEAGAGTGKTFTIVERVVALLASRTVRPDQILLLTFGRKAAAELRGRLMQRVGESSLQCQTFHSFAWNLLSSHLYDCGLSPETTVIEDAEARVEFLTAFEDYLSASSLEESGFPLRSFNRDELRGSLFKIRQDLKQEGTSIAQFRGRALAAADAFAGIAYRELRRPYARRTGGRDYDTLVTVTHDEFAQQIAEEKARVRAVALIFERFDRRLADRHCLTYADILARAEEALAASPGLREELRERYRCCIVDEYQDTDRAQHRFLEALFGVGFERVMVVGDVLQSIYSFRGAHPQNVEIFKQAGRTMTYTLSENRRSVQEILHLAHEVVTDAHADAVALAAARGSAGAQVVHVSSLWDDDAGSAQASPGHKNGYIPFDEARVLEARAVAKRITHLLHSKMQVHDRNDNLVPIAPQHIAILSRTKLNVGPVTDALLDAGIPFKLVGGVGFYDAPEIRDALAWLRLLADPFHSPALTRALQSQAIGAGDAIVARLARNVQGDPASFAREVLTGPLPEGDDAEAEGARAAGSAVRTLLDELAPYAALPLLSALRAVYERTGMEHFYHESTHHRAAQARANLDKLEALARGFAQDTPGVQPGEFVAFVGELEGIEYDEREADVPAAAAVTLSTIHSAKGLEWPIVFVLSVWPDDHKGSRLFVHDDGSLLYGEAADGSRPLHFLAVTERTNSEGWLPRRDEQPKKDDAEERRLLYVAITRARDRIFVSGLRRRPSKAKPEGSTHKFLTAIYDWVLGRGWPSDDHRELPVPARWTPPARQLTVAPVLRPVQPTHVRGMCPPLSYSLIADFEQCARRAVYRAGLRLPQVATPQRRARARRGWDDPVDADMLESPQVCADDDALLKAGDFGAMVHKALELWAIAKRDGVTKPLPQLIEDAGRVLDLSPGDEDRRTAIGAIEHVAQAFARWTVLLVEAPFTIDVGSEGDPQLLFGYLDLLARDEQGRVCLVDYKSGGALGTQFGLQLALYRTAAKSAYGIEVERSYIGRVKENAFELEAVSPADDEEVRAVIERVRQGFAACDTRANAGAWCGKCGYRKAPCMDFKR